MFSDESKSNGKGLFDQTWSNADKDSQEESFSAVSVSAIFSLMGGFFSLLCFVNHSLFWIPLITLGLVVWTLWSIRRSDGGLTGAPLARAALFLLIIPLVAVPIQNAIYRQQLIRQAKEFFPLVIQAAQKGDALALHQLEKYQTSRDEIPDEAAYWAKQKDNPFEEMELHSFIQNKTLLTLAALGENANITYDQTLHIAKNPNNGCDHIIMAYAVTFSEFGEKKTFFIPLYGIRKHDAKNHVSLWRRSSFDSKPLKRVGSSFAYRSKKETTDP